MINMECWGIKARQTVERKELAEVGLVTVKHDIDVWMLIHGMNIGMFSNELDCDCLVVREHILKERIPFAEMAKEDGHIKSFEIVKFEIKEIGRDTSYEVG